MTARLFFGALALPLLSAAPAAAGDTLDVSSRLLVERRLPQPGGGTAVEQVPAVHAVPGDVVSVVVAYRNTGAQPLANIAISNPVPAGLRFRGPSSPGLEMSVDGVRFGPLATLTMPMPGGGVRPARADEVTAVRWRPAASLAPGSSGRFSFAASVR